MKEKGFTMVEILVVMAITAIVGTVLVMIFTNTLRGSNKSQILAVIKQNGQAALDNMDKTIRNADNLLCPVDSSQVDTLVVEQGGVYTRYRITPSGSTNSYVPSECLGLGANGCIVQDHPTKQRDQNGNLETDSVFANIVCTPVDPIPRSSQETFNILTDTNLKSGVSIESGFFSASKLDGYQSSIKVQFVLKSGEGMPAAVASQIDPVTFQTSVQLR